MPRLRTKFQTLQCNKCKRFADNRFIRPGEPCPFSTCKYGVIILPRKVIGETRHRTVRRNGVNFRIEVNWHWLENGAKYHYIHVYRGINKRPFRAWRWATDAEDNFLRWV